MNERMWKLVQGIEKLYPHELEKQFPRIMYKIIDLWDTPQLDDYFIELMIDSRGGGRQGFPHEVATEIHRLSQVYDRLSHGEDKPASNPWAHIDIEKQHAIEEQGYKCTSQDFLKAADANNRTAVGLYLSAGFPVDLADERGWTPLMISSFNGNEEIAKLLIQSGANVNARDAAGYGPMHWAAFNGYVNVIKLLVIKQADVNAQSQHGWTPLLQAATRGHLTACSILIASGANVNLASKDGWTPLHKACANGHFEVAKLLLTYHADRNAKHQDGATPLSIATKNKREDIVALLNGKM